MSQANKDRLQESVDQLRAGKVEEHELIDTVPAANMAEIRDLLSVYGYAHVGDSVELTPAQREELSTYGFTYDEKSRRVSRT